MHITGASLKCNVSVYIYIVIMFIASICLMNDLLIYEIVMIYMCTHQFCSYETTEFIINCNITTIAIHWNTYKFSCPYHGYSLLVTESLQVFTSNNIINEFRIQMLWYINNFHTMSRPLNHCQRDMAFNLYVLRMTPWQVIEHMYFKGSVVFVVLLCATIGTWQWQCSMIDCSFERQAWNGNNIS